MMFLKSSIISLACLSIRMTSVSATDPYCERVVTETSVNYATKAWKQVDFDGKKCVSDNPLYALQLQNEDICSNGSPIGCNAGPPHDFTKWYEVLHQSDNKITKVRYWVCHKSWRVGYPDDLKCTNSDGKEEGVIACCAAPTIWTVDGDGKLTFASEGPIRPGDVPLPGLVTHINTDFANYVRHSRGPPKFT